jgi:flagellin
MSVNDVSLTASTSKSLLTLTNTSQGLNKTLQSLSTGKKSQEADPQNFSMAQSLLSQMSDFADKKDSMTNAVTTGNQAQAGYKGVSTLLQSAQGVASAAQDSNDPTAQAGFAASYKELVDQANQMASDAGIASSSASVMPSNVLSSNSGSELSASRDALNSQSADAATSLSSTSIRQDFTDSMMNTLQAGADNLTLVDLNEQAAKALTQQTQQQLGTTALGLSAKSAQSVLKMFA